jgi:hypothetical protein
MIDELLAINKITRFDYLVYSIFECTEHGRELLNKALLDTYKEEPSTMDSGGIGLAFIDGRRSYFRDILRSLDFTKQKLRDDNNDGSKPEPRKWHPE